MDGQQRECHHKISKQKIINILRIYSDIKDNEDLNSTILDPTVQSLQSAVHVASRLSVPLQSYFPTGLGSPADSVFQ